MVASCILVALLCMAVLFLFIKYGGFGMEDKEIDELWSF